MYMRRGKTPSFLVRGVKQDNSLNLKPGELVEVRSESEIAETLDEKGTLQGLPFMPEMRKYCNKRFRVLARVNKLIIEGGIGMRRLKNTVILDGVYCTGDDNEGCRRTCPVLWKESWLKRVRDAEGRQAINCAGKIEIKPVDVTTFYKKTYSTCQAIHLFEATSPLPKWDIRQYIWDISSGTYTPLGRLLIVLTTLHIKIQELLGRRRKPMLSGKLKRTPTESLGLRAGDLVEVKSKEEILATLDSRGRNRGLEFTPEMIKYCGKRFRVMRRLDKMMIEATGKMRAIPNTVILEKVTCDGKAHGGCQRNCHCFWREIWLKKVEEPIS